MADNKKPVRKVNPALLLRGAQALEKSAPVVETTNFGSRPRSDWRSPEQNETSSKSSAEVTPPVSEGTQPPKAPVSASEVRQSKLSTPKAKPVSEAPVPGQVVPKRRVASRFALEEDLIEEPITSAEPVEVKRPREVAVAEDTSVNKLDLGNQGRIVKPGFLTPSDRVRNVKPFTPVANPAPRPSYSKKAEAVISAEEWTDDESSDTTLGLGAEKDNSKEAPKYARGFHLTERDIIMMKFLARYRYAYTDQLARLVDTMPRSIISRMSTLAKRGFVRKQPITERQYLWMTTKAGNMLIDNNFGEIKKGAVSYATIAHTIGLANLGVELEREAGGRDILGERDDPDDEAFRNRYKLGIWGNEPDDMVLGEMTVTEREIRQSQLRWRGGRSTAEMRELVEFAVADTEEQQEVLEGNEGLFVVYGQAGRDGEHIPDLVVARPRDEEGKPQHLAIELELTSKPLPEWKRILRWYRDNGQMYSKVIYFTHKRSLATALRRADEGVGLGDRLVIRKYIPQNGKMPFWG